MRVLALIFVIGFAAAIPTPAQAPAPVLNGNSETDLEVVNATLAARHHCYVDETHDTDDRPECHIKGLNSCGVIDFDSNAREGQHPVQIMWPGLPNALYLCETLRFGNMFRYYVGKNCDCSVWKNPHCVGPSYHTTKEGGTTPLSPPAMSYRCFRY